MNDLTEQPGADLGDEVQLQFVQPKYDALNGSGRIIVGNSDIGKSATEIGPIPSDAM